jgi:hypothetical protein
MITITERNILEARLATLRRLWTEGRAFSDSQSQTIADEIAAIREKLGN